MKKLSEAQKDNLLKTFTLIGVITVIIVCLWVAVQFVQAIPSIFSSLGGAITATTHVQEELTLGVPDTLVETNEDTTLSWTTSDIPGVYRISHACTDVDVAVTLLDEEVTLTCDTAHTLADGEQGNTTLALSSGDRRFVDVPVTLTFIPEDDIFETQHKTITLTVFNKDISLSESVGVDLDEQEQDEEETSTPAQQAPQKPVFTTIFSVSDPRGFVDLSVSFLDIGVARNGQFIPRDELEAGERGAVRFAVQNLGTKTSDDWTFIADFPTSRSNTFESKRQHGLAPQERSVITLEFDTTNDDGRHEISALVETDNDVVRINDDFFVSVSVD